MTTRFLKRQNCGTNMLKAKLLNKERDGERKKKQSWEMEEPYLLQFYSPYINSINIEILSFFGRLISLAPRIILCAWHVLNKFVE